MGRSQAKLPFVSSFCSLFFVFFVSVKCKHPPIIYLTGLSYCSYGVLLKNGSDKVNMNKILRILDYLYVKRKHLSARNVYWCVCVCVCVRVCACASMRTISRPVMIISSC